MRVLTIFPSSYVVVISAVAASLGSVVTVPSALWRTAFSLLTLRWGVVILSILGEGGGEGYGPRPGTA